MQATVLDFDPTDGSGHVVLDSGTPHAFSAAVFEASRLRLLRPGQRVRIDLGDDGVRAITISTLPDPG